MNLTLGQKIRSLRKSKGLTQSELADILGVHLQTISRYEKDKLVPGPDVLSVLAEKFQLDANELLGLTVKEETPERHVHDPITEKIIELLKGMDEEKRREVLKYTAEKKQLADLLAQLQDKKTG